MKIGEFAKKVARAVLVPTGPTLPFERSAAEQYAADCAEYEAAQRTAVAAIREKLNDPHWRPRSWIPTGLRPPVNPNERITIPSPFDPVDDEE